jgi:Ketopantoate reductase PanE/ApbA C terminal
MPAVVYCGAERVSPGTIVHHRSSRLIIPEGEAGARLAHLFAGTGVEVVQTPDFLTESWRKLLVNVAANPIMALTMRLIGALREPDVNDLARKLLAEAVAVGASADARLTLEDAKRILEAQFRHNENATALAPSSLRATMRTATRSSTWCRSLTCDRRTIHTRSRCRRPPNGGSGLMTRHPGRAKEDHNAERAVSLALSWSHSHGITGTRGRCR